MLTGAGGRVRRGLPLVALIAASGCATTGGATDGQREGDEIVIEVQNDNFNQATVFIPGGRRIGIVGGKSTATFSVEWYLPEVEITIRLLTGGSARLRPRSGSRGETWEFVIPATCC